MPYFSKKSILAIDTLHPDLQTILYEAIKIMDFSVICGLRNEAEQEYAVKIGTSNASYPNSKHNRSMLKDGTYSYTMSDAVDIVPYPVRWPNIQEQTSKEYVRRMGRFYRLAGIIQTLAFQKDITVRWGGDFKSLFDGPHFELVR